MKTVGKQVLFIGTTDENPRNGESSFVRLKDGSILFAFTQYYAGEWDDHGTARIAACRSCDEGETWSRAEVLMEKDAGAQNYMSVSLLRLKNGDLAMIWLRKARSENGALMCMPVFSRSKDEGKTWSPWIFCTQEQSYYCTINDGVLVTKSGRIIVPMANCSDGFRFFGGRIRFACSDDNGETWFDLPQTITSPYEDNIGLQEPGLYEHEDGSLWAYFRTAYGYQYQSHSEDAGNTWSPAVPNFRFSSPDSPMRVRRVGPVTAAVFNPVGYSCLSDGGEAWGSPKRTPLVLAVSRDDGRSFDGDHITFANGALRPFVAGCFLLETDRTNSYCYPAICETEDGFLVAYYHSNGTPKCLNSTKIVKVRFDELQ